MNLEEKRDFENLSRQLEGVHKEIEGLLPRALIKRASAFGNSSHVVLSKDLLDKEVGVIVLGKKGGEHGK